MIIAIPLSAQMGQDELNLQKMFIDASREKLLGAYDEAATLYRQILEQDPDNHAAAYELSRVYESMDRFEDALTQIDRAIRLDAANIWYQMMKADILEGMENYAGAIEVYRHLTTLNPVENYFFQHLVELLLKTNQLPEALEVLNTFESHAGVLPDIIRTKVDVLDQLGRKDEVLKELDKLIRVYPDNIEFLHVIASYCMQNGHEERAMAHYRNILEIDPNDAHANLGVADTYREEGHDVQYLRSIMPLMRNPSIALDAKIQEVIPYLERYIDAGDQQLGSVLGEVVSELVRYHGDNAKTHALYADYLYHSGQPLEAIREYEKTLVLDKSVYNVWEQLLHIYAELKDMNALIRTAKEAQEVFPNQAALYFMSGLAYAYKEDYLASREQLEDALIMSGRDVDLRFDVLSLLGSVYDKLGEHDKAYEALDKALELRPDNARVLNKYSYMLAENDEKLGQARTMAQKALATSPNDPSVEHTLGWIAFREGDFDGARGYLELSLDHGGGDDNHILEHYGDILYSLKKVDEAVEYWQLALERGNSSETLKRKISERKIVH